jgi:hypothetical protein
MARPDPIGMIELGGETFFAHVSSLLTMRPHNFVELFGGLISHNNGDSVDGGQGMCRALPDCGVRFWFA